VADISMADSYSAGNNNRNNNIRRRGSSDGDGRRKVAASLYVFCSMFFIPFLVCDGLCLSIFLFWCITAHLHSLIPHDTSLTIIYPPSQSIIPPHLHTLTFVTL
jgi:hypothetical protein